MGYISGRLFCNRVVPLGLCFYPQYSANQGFSPYIRYDFICEKEVINHM